MGTIYNLKKYDIWILIQRYSRLPNQFWQALILPPFALITQMNISWSSPCSARTCAVWTPFVDVSNMTKERAFYFSLLNSSFSLFLKKHCLWIIGSCPTKIWWNTKVNTSNQVFCLITELTCKVTFYQSFYNVLILFPVILLGGFLNKDKYIYRILISLSEDVSGWKASSNFLDLLSPNIIMLPFSH